MEERYISVKEYSYLNDVFDLVYIKNGKIVIKSNDKIVTIEFGDYPFRVTPDGMRLKTFRESEGLLTYIEKNNFKGNPFFKVDNSVYIKWLEAESGGVYTAGTTGIQVDHLAIVIRDYIIDIVYDKDFKPKIKCKKVQNNWYIAIKNTVKVLKSQD